MDLVPGLASELLPKLVEMEWRHRRLLKICHQKVNISLSAHEFDTACACDEKQRVGCNLIDGCGQDMFYLFTPVQMT